MAAFYLGALRGEQAERHSNSPRQHAESARTFAARSCRGLDPAAMFECVHDAAERSAETAHTEQDLIAQQDSAFAAKAMLGVSAMGTIFGLVGLWFVYQTLSETRLAAKAAIRSNEISEDTAKRQLRSYLVAKNVELEGVEIGTKASLTFEIKNVGQTPAYEFRLQPEISYFEGAWKDARNARIRFRRASADDPPSTKGSMVGAGEFVTFRMPYKAPFSAKFIQRIRDGKVTILLAGVASYRDAFGRRRLLTLSYSLNPANLADNGKAKLSAQRRGNKGN
jgi:hypothetical protein